MTAGNGRGRYDLTEPEGPEPKTRAEAAALARTWEEWETAQPGANRYGARVLGVPWRLDWQSNERGLVPPGYIWVACLCFATICRPPDWRGSARGYDGREKPIRPAWTVGDLCGSCLAPYQRIADRHQPYRPPRDFYLSRCLCGVRCTRYGPEGGDCERCGAPFQSVPDSHAGYEVTLELGEQPGWRKFWARMDRLAWAAGDDDPPME